MICTIPIYTVRIGNFLDNCQLFGYFSVVFFIWKYLFVGIQFPKLCLSTKCQLLLFRWDKFNAEIGYDSQYDSKDAKKIKVRVTLCEVI
jgi:hypothetical protein